MNTLSRHDVTDTDGVPPDVRLCRQILRDSLAQGVSTVELVGAGSLPVVNRYVGGEWHPYMQVPPQPFAALVRQLKIMAELGPDRPQGEGTIRVRAGGRDADVSLSAKRSSDGLDMLVLGLPAPAAAA